MIRLATDVGGTFTDLLGYDEQTGKVYSAKSLTTVLNQSDGVMNTIKTAIKVDGLNTQNVDFFVHGGTTVINAITERKGVKTALITTNGFRDVLEIGRGNRPDLYNLKFRSPQAYVNRQLRFEIDEFTDSEGQSVSEPNVSELKKIAAELKKMKVESVAIMFIQSYANPHNEQVCKQILEAHLPNVSISCSHEITRLWREYERSNTVVLNAYVKPIINKYFHSLEQALDAQSLTCPHYAMLSNGGVALFKQAVETPLNLIESGPSAGIAGAARIGELIGEKNILAFDVGGTTAKCSIIVGGKPIVFSDYKIEWTRLSPGYPVQVPVVDIVEIGAGGGSIAYIDEQNTLKVGPKSAGASPGPVCYGLGGTEPTVTDAKLITGVLDAENFAGGEFKLNLSSARAAMVKLAEQLELSVAETAQAIIAVAEANMINALKLVTIQRGYDPREFTLVISGGAGPMFAASLGKELNVKQVVIPPHAGIFSAWGMLAARPRVDLRKTWFKKLNQNAISSLHSLIDTLKQEARAYFEISNDQNIDFQVSLQLRYQGQEHSVTTRIHSDILTDDIKHAFHQAHKTAYSFNLTDAAIEITGVHVVGELDSQVITNPDIKDENWQIEDAIVGHREVYLGADMGWRKCRILLRDKMPLNLAIDGPLLVEEPTTTTLVLQNQQIIRNSRGILILKTIGGI
ncbi:MAG: hydantoinase/oxoprolinase family protein [Alphaproteobacteria bacterium]|nr:hydantoinase/oxoprolinase family protein [Alphaproteobacteria bacterium]